MFARVMRERHPGVVVVPLGRVGTNRTVVAPAPGQIVRPFATPKDRDTVLDGNSIVAALQEDRVDRASKYAPSVLDG
jgi:hypothetical protein